jgi:hypothetical protein
MIRRPAAPLSYTRPTGCGGSSATHVDIEDGEARLVRRGEDCATAVCAPVRGCVCCISKQLFGYVLSAIIIVGVLIGMLVYLLTRTTAGTDLLHTTVESIIASGQDALVGMLEGLNSDIGALLFRTTFTTDAGATPFATQSPRGMTGWLEVRHTLTRFFVTVRGIPLADIRAVALAHGTNGVWNYYVVSSTPIFDSVNNTFQATLTCPSPWPSCSSILSARLAGDPFLVLLLSVPPNPTPLQSDVLLSASVAPCC